MNILIINTGSSSVRLSLFCHSEKQKEEKFDRICFITAEDRKRALDGFLGDARVEAVGHRFVHGGFERQGHTLIDDNVETALKETFPLAPLHNPFAYQWLQTAREMFGSSCAHAAVFDTAFFRTLPEKARAYAIPRDLVQQFHLYRVGFHGIAHEFMYREIKKHLGSASRIITLQLGSGCSAAAIRDGVVVDTSMGFSPLEGLMMSTRPGDIDAGVLCHLLEQLQLAPDELRDLLNRRSGLLGLSGISGDMKELLTQNSQDAQFAVECFCYRIRKYLGAFSAVLGGVDAIAFGGGIGEHGSEVRARVLEDFDWLGVRIDAERNKNVKECPAEIQEAGIRVKVFVVTVQEDMIIRDVTEKLCLGMQTY